MYFSAAAVNSLGLALDIAGVILLFFFGLPSKASDAAIPKWSYGQGESYRRVRCLSNLGLGLLVVGFALQIVSNWLG